MQQASTPGESDLDDGTNSKSEEGVEDNGGRANGLAEEAFGFLDPSQGLCKQWAVRL